ncbi:hypothetical protein [Blastococcus sp. PRF04-17]|uniref:hypothetical protein n=1 Tax=Blastococcus sp. PRF04-17 TaxID=2933797 RepID=UPI001FF3CBCF|nr:hypothetical protein [Blastococcus sp. PRF04-17]UOY02850.1 hypothetical protein MVA48_05705 [Blastococcus sp. PRF04-17]
MTSDPWSDPATPTEPGAPYTGPPPSDPYRVPGGPSPYGPPVYGAAPYTAYGPPQQYPGWPPYGAGHPGYWMPPGRPQRPGGVIAAAVLAFVQAGIVVIASIYLWFFASLADLALSGVDSSYSPAVVNALATEGTALAIIQLVSAVLLVGAGVRALNARTAGARRLLLGAHAVQVALSLYWAVRLTVVLGDGAESGPLLAFTAIFAAGPIVSIGLLLTAVARQWFRSWGPNPAS